MGRSGKEPGKERVGEDLVLDLDPREDLDRDLDRDLDQDLDRGGQGRETTENHRGDRTPVFRAHAPLRLHTARGTGAVVTPRRREPKPQAPAAV